MRNLPSPRPQAQARDPATSKPWRPTRLLVPVPVPLNRALLRSPLAARQTSATRQKQRDVSSAPHVGPTARRAASQKKPRQTLHKAKREAKTPDPASEARSTRKESEAARRRVFFVDELEPKA